MSFTTEIYQSIYKDMKEKPVDSSKTMAMRLVTYHNEIMTAFGINRKNELKSIYISVGNDLDMSVSFPKWNGVNINVVELPDYEEQTKFVVLNELPDGVDYIFEIVAEDLRKNVELIVDTSFAYKTVYDVLTKWKMFFQYDGKVFLSEEKQQGLYGELLFLEYCMRKMGNSAISCWAGCNSETHDFYFGDNAVEIKTTSTKEPYYAHISSEYQLDVLDVNGNLFLKFYALRKSQSSGEKLPVIIERIRSKLKDTVALKALFNEKIRKYGYLDEARELYTTGYYVRDEYSFKVENGFPCITSRSLSSGLSQVNYALSIESCNDYSVDIADALIITGGFNCDN